MAPRFWSPLWTLFLIGAGADPTQLSCYDMGYSETVVCSGCDKLYAITKDVDLERECRGCCTDDSVLQSVKFTSASLEYCN